jgi:hypothetical protein
MSCNNDYRSSADQWILTKGHVVELITPFISLAIAEAID